MGILSLKKFLIDTVKKLKMKKMFSTKTNRTVPALNNDNFQ